MSPGKANLKRETWRSFEFSELEASAGRSLRCAPHRMKTLLTSLVVCLFSLAAVREGLAQSSSGNLSGQPDVTMTAAQQSFEKGDKKKAAGQIHQAADYMKEESTKVGDSAKAGLRKAADDLHKLGDGVKNGTVKTGDELKKGFAKADQALAKAWHATAEESKEAGKDASVALGKAGHALEGAAIWSGTQLKKGTLSAVNGVKKAGKATGQGVKAGAEDVESWFKGIGEGIKHVGSKL